MTGGTITAAELIQPIKMEEDVKPEVEITYTEETVQSTQSPAVMEVDSDEVLFFVSFFLHFFSLFALPKNLESRHLP